MPVVAVVRMRSMGGEDGRTKGIMEVAYAWVWNGLVWGKWDNLLNPKKVADEQRVHMKHAFTILPCS